MDAPIERAYNKLSQNLEDLTKLYRQLLDCVRKEKQILLDAKLEQLHDNNISKDQILMKIKLADTLRTKHAGELAVMIKADVESPRLLELAQRLGGVAADRLRAQHATLDLVIKRLTELNKENEIYAQNALGTLNGTMSDIKETLGGSKTYEKKGQYKVGPDQTGNFVRKEV